MKHDAAKGQVNKKPQGLDVQNIRIFVELAGPRGPRAMRHDAAKGQVDKKPQGLDVQNLRIFVKLGGPRGPRAMRHEGQVDKNP